jgi:hypothetical protein
MNMNDRTNSDMTQRNNTCFQSGVTGSRLGDIGAEREVGLLESLSNIDPGMALLIFAVFIFAVLFIF